MKASEWRTQLNMSAEGAYTGQFDEKDCLSIIEDLESLEAEIYNLRIEKHETEIVVEGIIKERDSAIADLAQSNARLEVMREAGDKPHHVLLYRDEHDISPLGEFSKEEHEAIDAWQALAVQPKGDVRERVANIIVHHDVNDDCANVGEVIDRILSAIAGVEKEIA